MIVYFMCLSGAPHIISVYFSYFNFGWNTILHLRNNKGKNIGGPLNNNYSILIKFNCKNYLDESLDVT